MLASGKRDLAAARRFLTRALSHGRLKARLRPMRGPKRLRSAQIIGSGHAFVQNIRRGHYEPGVDADPRNRLTAAFTELTLAI